MAQLARAHPEDRKRIISQMTPLDLLRLDAKFECWAQGSRGDRRGSRPTRAEPRPGPKSDDNGRV
jgi:hypothetical protein